MDHTPTLAEMRDRVRHARMLEDRDLRAAMMESVMADAIALAIASGNLAGAYNALMRLGFERHEIFRHRGAAIQICGHRMNRDMAAESAAQERRIATRLAREFGLTVSGPHGDEPLRPLPRSPGLAEMVERISRTLAGALVVFGVVPAALLLILP